MTGKKKILAISGIGLILVGVLVFVVKRIQGPKSLLNPLPTTSPSEPEEKNLTYNDEAGFSFEYPEGLEIKDESGQNDYSVLKITAADKTGEMVIRVVDTKYKTIDDWLKKAPEATGAGDARNIELAGMTGQQIQIENPRRLVTIAIDKGVMYYLESPLNEESVYWNKTHNTIVSSFVLGEAKTEAGSQTTSGGGEDVIYEEEEVVE